MATWTVHLRIAQKFIDALPFLESKEFIAGSLAPDCGYKNIGSGFTPPPTVTHFSETGMKNDCNYKAFAKDFLQNSKTYKEYSFYLGYYIHLLTDILWSFNIYMPTYDIYGADSKNNPDLVKKIKADWSLLDLKYYCKNSSKPFFNILESIDEIPDYMPFYEEGQLLKQLKEIAALYQPYKGAQITKSTKYISDEKVSKFIQLAYETISIDLKTKKFDKPEF